MRSNVTFLAAGVAGRYRVLALQRYPYLLLNLIGSAMLVVLAYEERSSWRG